MKISYNVTGAKRTELAKAVASVLGGEITYLGVPSFSYQIAEGFLVTRGGELIIPDGTDEAEVQRLLAELATAGFSAESELLIEEQPQETTEEEDGERDGLSVEVPRESLTDEAINNIEKIVESKGDLMKHAFKVDSLPLEVDDEKVTFRWFSETDADSVTAYTQFVSAVCDMARTQKRITAKPKTNESERYSFRCFLIRLGFIGADFKEMRKILLRNLSGSSAFPTQRAAEEFATKQKEKRDAKRREVIA